MIDLIRFKLYLFGTAQTVENSVIIKSVPLNVSPTLPETLSLPTRH